MWRAIKNYEGFYEVSDQGEVRSVDRYIPYIARSGKQTGQLHRGKVITQHDNGNGYKQVSLWKDNKAKTYYVHRLVGEAFIPNPNNLPEINHKDLNRGNNNVSNLEWCSSEYNQNYADKPKRGGQTLLDNGKTSTRVIKCDMNGNELATYRSMGEAERENNLSHGAISAYFRKGHSHCGGFTWKKIIKEGN